MGAFDRFWEREELLKKNMVIDNSAYQELKKLAKNRYQTSANQLINACIEELIKTENITIYPKKKKEIQEQHSLLIRASLFEGLEKLNKKYSLSIYLLLNIAIKNALEEEKRK